MTNLITTAITMVALVLTGITITIITITTSAIVGIASAGNSTSLYWHVVNCSSSNDGLNSNTTNTTTFKCSGQMGMVEGNTTNDIPVNIFISNSTTPAITSITNTSNTTATNATKN